MKDIKNATTKAMEALQKTMELQAAMLEGIESGRESSAIMSEARKDFILCNISNLSTQMTNQEAQMIEDVLAEIVKTLFLRLLGELGEIFK